MWKKSSLRVLLFTSLVVLFIGGFNYIVDPFDIFDSPKIVGFNANKPEIATHIRQYKAIKLQKLKPVTIFIGTSRTEQGIDPTNSNLDSKLSWNSAISSGLPLEYEYYIDAAIKNGAKHIIIGADLFSFYTKESTKGGFNKDAFGDFDALKYLLSIDALISSIKTVASKKPTPYLQSGMQNPAALQSEIDDKGGHKKIFQESEKGYFFAYYSKQLNKTQTVHWEAFERILDKAYKNSVNVTIFISPSHARQWEVLAITQGWGMFEEFRRRIVAINDKVASQNNKPPFALWDFAGYHLLTTETVPDDSKAKMKWYWDSSHYKKELGDILLDRMFDGNFSGGQEYPDFGVKLTSQNIDSHLARLRAEREKWRSSHPVDVAEIEALKKR